MLWLWHFLYSVGPHPVSSLHINTFVVSQAFMAGAASQAGDADSSRAPDLTSGLQGSVNVHRDALLLVPQWQCISSFVLYILFKIHAIYCINSRILVRFTFSHTCMSHYVLLMSYLAKLLKVWIGNHVWWPETKSRSKSLTTYANISFDVLFFSMWFLWA